MGDEVRVDFESRRAIERLVEDTVQDLMDRLDTVATRYDLGDRDVVTELRRVGPIDLVDVWQEYVEEGE